jgi:2-oxopent-4-enoate/cis-2-oxohex-4-enoate hydratase
MSSTSSGTDRARKELHDSLAAELYSALRERRTVPPLRGRGLDLEIDDAYAISLGILGRRLNDGERVVGKKIGVTSKPVQEMLGVHQPDFGFLTDRMWIANGDTVRIAESMIQPRAEAEIALILRASLKGPGVTPADVLEATEAVAPCFEIVDSRISNWDIRIVDTIADNASCGVFVLGNDPKDPLEVDLSLVGMTIEVQRPGSPETELFATGAGAAVKGSPVNSVVWLANTLAALGTPCRAGEVVLSGSLTVMAWLKEPQTITCSFGGLGSCTVTFE